MLLLVTCFIIFLVVHKMQRLISSFSLLYAQLLMRVQSLKWASYSNMIFVLCAHDKALSSGGHGCTVDILNAEPNKK